MKRQLDYIDVNTIECSGLKFVRRTNDGSRFREEAWTVVPPITGLTHFCIKNYGGEPEDTFGFSGWRVVSGGPFCSAGGWNNRKDAMLQATPWLLAYFINDAKEKLEKAQSIVAALSPFLEALHEQSHSPQARRSH